MVCTVSVCLGEECGNSSHEQVWDLVEERSLEVHQKWPLHAWRLSNRLSATGEDICSFQGTVSKTWPVTWDWGFPEAMMKTPHEWKSDLNIHWLRRMCCCLPQYPLLGLPGDSSHSARLVGAVVSNEEEKTSPLSSRVTRLGLPEHTKERSCKLL